MRYGDEDVEGKRDKLTSCNVLCLCAAKECLNFLVENLLMHEDRNDYLMYFLGEENIR